MYINEAIISAKAESKAIKRQSWGDYSPVIVPTNSIASILLYNPRQRYAAPNWQPEADDLIADDWIIAY